ncbi:archease [Candidatus Falkowbacteria bacterium]|nr:archease [Candidatus Falkowbacteria bacterium]
MPYCFREHTADIRMNVEGKTLNELFGDALLGMIEIMTPIKSRSTAIVKREIEIESADTTALLVDFLNEALAMMSTEHEAYTKVVFQALSERSLKAELEGYNIESFGEDIKAVTYHEANVKKNNDGQWTTTIVFDI